MDFRSKMLSSRSVSPYCYTVHTWPMADGSRWQECRNTSQMPAACRTKSALSRTKQSETRPSQTARPYATKAASKAAMLRTRERRSHSPRLLKFQLEVTVFYQNP